MLNRVKIWKGMDHRLFFTIIRDSLEQGPDHVCATDRRVQWLGNNRFRFPGALLVSYFAYVDGILGSKWIENYGKRQRRELYTLRHVRNAITHFDGDLTKLRKNKVSKPGRPQDPCLYVRKFVRGLNSGKVAKVQEGAIPSYITISGSGVVTLEQSAFGRLAALLTLVLQRANLIVPEAT